MESSEDVYYSENTEIIDGDDCWGMQESVIIDNDNLNWQEEGPEITVSYSEAADDVDQTLTESEVYLSTNTEDCIDSDKSQYYSILESTYQNEEDNVSANIIVKVDNQDEAILPDLPESEEYSVESDINKDITNDESLSSQVVLYHSDDPNEMYAVQIADDGSGNLQRYKYKVRQTVDGQLEAIPGTIEIQDTSIEDEIIEKTGIPEDIRVSESSAAQEEKSGMSKAVINKIKIDKKENNINKTKEEFLSSKDNSTMSEDNFDATESYLDEEYGTPEYLLSDDNTYEEDDFAVVNSNENELGLKFQKSYHLELNSDNDYSEENMNLLTELPKRSKQASLENGSSNILHPTAQVMKHKFMKSKFNNSPLHDYDEFNKHMSDDKEVTIIKDEKSVSYLVIDTKEKENVSVTQIKTTFGVKNARSILKTNYVVPTVEPKKNLTIKKVTSVRMLNNNKALAPKEKDTKSVNEKCEENKGTEVKIAAKSVRQPRKQTIKPVERLGSEIIVQPMYYTFNNDFNDLLIRKKRKYTHRNSQEVVKVSDDSDPDYSEKPKPKKKNIGFARRNTKYKKVTQIVIDSEISTDEESVIEVLSDIEMENKDKEIDVKENNTIIIDSLEKIEEENDLDKSDDILKIQEAVDNIVQERKRAEKSKCNNPTEKTNSNDISKPVDTTNKRNNIKCPICPKTFPRQINLKIHMNIHTARRVLRSKTNSVVKADNRNETKSVVIKKLDANINAIKNSATISCIKCKLKFLSQTQLARHQIIHTDKKIFRKSLSPRKHKILKNSRNLCSSVINKLKSNSPTKTSISKSSVDTKNVMFPPKRQFKCEYCNKCFSQRILLNTHRAIHKPFACCNCSIKFSTKILLDEHLRKSCVKTAVLSRQNLMQRSALKKKSVPKQILKCSTCYQFFSTLTKLNEHESITHKNKVSNNKSSSTKIIMARPKKAHGGVPASTKMQKALDIMKLRS